MASGRQLVPCPMGSACPTAGKRHYADTDIYHDHQRIASGNFGGSPQDQEARRKNAANPLSDIQGTEVPHDGEEYYVDSEHNGGDSKDQVAAAAAAGWGFQRKKGKGKKKGSSSGHQIGAYERNSPTMKAFSKFLDSALAVFR